MSNEAVERELTERVRVRLDVLAKANAAPRCHARSKRTGKPCRVARRAASNATCGHAARAGLLPPPRLPRPRCKRISKSGNGSSACAPPVSNALTLTQKSVPSGQRFELKQICGRLLLNLQTWHEGRLSAL